MARPPIPIPPLTPERAALADSLELFVEGMLGAAQLGPAGFVFTLPVKPDLTVATELRRRYVAAGWPRVFIGERPGSGEPFIQLEASVDVFLSDRRHA